MSALTILIVVVAAVPYTIELQTDSNLNDVITWLNHPERFTQTKNKIKVNQPEQNVKFKNYFKTLIKKTAKILQHEDKNKFNYFDQTHLDKVDNQPLKIHNSEREANNKEVLNQYLVFKPPWLKSLQMKRKPNYQLERGHGGNNLYEDSRNNDLTGYSKIYLVLNPEAKLEKSDVRNIGNLLSSMLSKINSNNKSAKKDLQERMYKGFVIRDIRRRVRESKEAFGKKESMEHDHKSKRGRKEYSGSRGRTGIPYVRQRGDVYERE